MQKETSVHNSQDIFRPAKKRRRIRPFWWWIGGLLILGALLIGVLYLLVYAGFLQVRTVTVLGAHLNAPSDVELAVTRELEDRSLRALLGPDHILFWALGRKEVPPSPLLADLSSIGVQVDLLNRMVTINVHERQAIGVWCSGETACYSFDASGTLFAQAPDVFGSLLLRVDDESGRVLSVGQPALPDPTWLPNLLQTLDGFRGSGIAVTGIHIKDLSVREWQADTSVGPVFYFSLTSVPSDFTGTLKDLPTRVNLSTLTYLDFRVPGRIYYK